MVIADAVKRATKQIEQERDALAMQVAKMRSAFESCITDLEGGFIRCERCGDQEDTKDMDVLPIMRKALALPDTSSIIKRHDAEMLNEVVERIIDAASIGGGISVEVVRRMIKELGAK